MRYLREHKAIERVVKREKYGQLRDCWWMCIIVHCNDRSPEDAPLFGQPKLYTTSGHFGDVGAFGSLSNCYEVYPEAVVSFNHDDTVSIVPRTKLAEHQLVYAADELDIPLREEVK